MESSYYHTTDPYDTTTGSTNHNQHDYAANRSRRSFDLRDSTSNDRQSILIRFINTLYRGRSMSLLNAENKDYYIKEVAYFIYHTYGNEDAFQNWLEAEKLIDMHIKNIYL